MSVTLRSGNAADAVGDSRPGHGEPRERASAAAHRSTTSTSTSRASSSRSEDEQVVGCAELAPLSPSVAEVRSLVVHESLRGQRIGTRLVAHLARRATVAGYATLCAFTHDPAHFVRLGFTIVPHIWMPEKIAHDCTGCALFRRCGQYAVRLTLRQGVGAAPERTAAMIHGRGVAPRRPNIERLQLTPVAVETADSRTRRRRTSGQAQGGRSRMIALETQIVAGGVTAPAGFRASGVACGIKANGKPDLRCSSAMRVASARGGLHHQRRAGGADPRVARPPPQVRRHRRQPWSSTAAAPTPAPAPTACARRRDDAADRRERWAARQNRSWSPRPASSASSWRWRKS